MSTIEITTEHLGTEATTEDLRNYEGHVCDALDADDECTEYETTVIGDTLRISAEGIDSDELQAITDRVFEAGGW